MRKGFIAWVGKGTIICRKQSGVVLCIMEETKTGLYKEGGKPKPM